MRPNGQILTVEQMRAAEQALIDGGETVASLMERAGHGAADYVFRIAAGRPVTVLCGPGNNGGDGYVIARVLAARGVPVAVIAPLAPASEAARAASKAWGGARVEHAGGHVFVDCLFGSGLARPLADELRELLVALACAHACRVAVDLPSGVESDSGARLNDGLPGYDLTIALGAWKFAHWQLPGAGAMGERRLVEIGIAQVPGAARLIERPRLPPPAPDAHKYTRGLLAVIGGAMPGAGALAARAAMRSGAGYVKLLAGHRSPATPDELVVEDRPLSELPGDDRIDALLIGPGLGRDVAAGERLAQALRAGRAMVGDADALVLLEPDMLAGRTAALIVTPHAGELAALCRAFGITEAARAEQAGALARAMDAVVIAKGPGTLVAAPGEPLLVSAPASSWLSAAGTGDVLAGIVASRLATGARPVEAAAQAVWLHGEAARIAGPALIAGDLIAALPRAIAACR